MPLAKAPADIFIKPSAATPLIIRHNINDLLHSLAHSLLNILSYIIPMAFRSSLLSAFKGVISICLQNKASIQIGRPDLTRPD